MSEDQNYRETVRGVRAFMGWTHIPDLEYSPASRTDNPWEGNRAQPVGKVSVLLPPEDWLCRKLENLNLVLIEGYPSKSSEPGGLHVDQFLRPPKSQSRWYGIHPAEPKDPTRLGKSVNTWPNDAAKINSAFPRICKPSTSASQPSSRPISQDTLRKWENAAKETSYICNQSAGCNRCITKIQDSVQENLKALQTELSKGKSSAKAQAALDELHYLTSFNQNVSFAMGKSLQHLSDFTFVQMANLTLLRRDSYWENLRPGVKHDTFSALRNCPLNGYALFPDAVIRKAEDEKNNNNNAVSNHTLLIGNNHRTPPAPQARIWPHGKLLVVGADPEDEVGKVSQDAAPALPRKQHSINDNYCIVKPVPVARSRDGVLSVQRQDSAVSVHHHAFCPVVSPVLFVQERHSQKKDISPSLKTKETIKFVKGVSVVDHCVFAQHVPSVPNVAHTQLVGGRLQHFWQTWSLLGTNLRVVSILKEEYVVPSNIRPPLVRDPLIISGYANPLRNPLRRRLCMH